jgi:hypothetical protein
MYYTHSGIGRTWAEWLLGEDPPPGTPGSGDITASCYSDDLNDQIIAMCRRGDPACSGENIAQLLELDYCDDYWDQMMRSSGYISTLNAALLAGISALASYLIYTELGRRASIHA